MRDDFLQSVKDTLAKRVNCLCSNPKCRHPTTGPHSDTSKTIIIGVAAHITAAAPGGKRYDTILTQDQRSHADNGIWLCQTCAKLIDSDEKQYTVTLLRQWKKGAEFQVGHSIKTNSPLFKSDRLNKRWLIFIVAIVVLLIVGLLAYIVKDTADHKEMLQMLGEIQLHCTQLGKDQYSFEERTREACRILNKQYRLPPGTLEKELPEVATDLLKQENVQLQDQANALFFQQNFADAEDVAIQAESIATSASAKVRALVTAGNAAKEQLHYERALKYYSKASSLINSRQDVILWSKVQSKNAEAYFLMGDYSKAVTIYQNVVRIQKMVLGVGFYDTIANMNNLAVAMQDAGQVREAIPLLQESLELCQKAFGPAHVFSIIAVNNVATAYTAADKGDLAIQFLENTLVKVVATLGPEHSLSLLLKNNLAMAHDHVGHYGRAISLLEDILSIYNAKYSPEHIDALISKNNLAIVYQHAGYLDKAMPLFEETLNTRRHCLGARHPDTIASMNNLGLLYCLIGAFDRAISLLNGAMENAGEVLGPEHPATLRTINNLVTVYLVKNVLSDRSSLDFKTVQMLEKTVLRQRNKIGPEHRDTLQTACNLVIAYELTGNRRKAVSLYADTLAIATQKGGVDCDATVKTMTSFALLFIQRQRYTEAEQFLVDSYEAMKMQKNCLPQVLVTLDQLIHLYQVLKQDDKVMKWEAIRDKYKKEGNSGAGPIPPQFPIPIPGTPIPDTMKEPGSPKKVRLGALRNPKFTLSRRPQNVMPWYRPAQESIDGEFAHDDRHTYSVGLSVGQ